MLFEEGYYTGQTTTVNPATGKEYGWIRFLPDAMQGNQIEAFAGNNSWILCDINEGQNRTRISWSDERSIEGRLYSRQEVIDGKPEREAKDWIKRGLIAYLKYKYARLKGLI